MRACIHCIDNNELPCLLNNVDSHQAHVVVVVVFIKACLGATIVDAIVEQISSFHFGVYKFYELAMLCVCLMTDGNGSKAGGLK